MANPVRYKGNFVDCQQQIREADQRIAKAREGMLDRIRRGADSHYKREGCWHPEGTVRIEEITYWCLAQFAPTTHYAQRTLEANAKGNYLALTEEIKLGRVPASELIKRIAEQDKKLLDYQRKVLIPSRQDTFSVDSLSLGDIDIARFLARDPKLAEKYGIFLNRTCGIPKVTFYQLPDSVDNVAAGFWLYGLGRGYDSGFDGDDRDFDDGDGSLVGVAKRGSAEPRKSPPKADAKISTPTLAEGLRYAEPFVPQIAMNDFRTGLERLFKK